MKKIIIIISSFLILLTLNVCQAQADKNLRLVSAAKEQIGVTLFYNSHYRKIDYPNGDIPIVFGVCSDVVIRALRKQSIDLQKEIHEDMRANFSQYPKNWGLKTTDKNIDHRRVPNIETYFKRKGYLVKSNKGKDAFLPGDIVTWRLDNGAPHIGIVSTKKNNKGERYIIHNIGWGTQEDDELFRWKIVGHYRLFPVAPHR